MRSCLYGLINSHKQNIDIIVMYTAIFKVYILCNGPNTHCCLTEIHAGYSKLRARFEECCTTTVGEFCTEQTCPVMSGGPKFEYYWADETHKKPQALPATQV